MYTPAMTPSTAAPVVPSGRTEPYFRLAELLMGHPHRFIDLEMMVSLGGKERIAADFRRLLDRAGLHFEQLHTIDGSFFSIVEGSRG